MLFGDKYHSGKGFWTQLLCFLEDREAFPKPCTSRNEKLVLSRCAGFPSRDELGVGGGGGDDRPPLEWCQTGTMVMHVPPFFQRLCCFSPLFLLGGARIPTGWWCLTLRLSGGAAPPPSLSPLPFMSFRAVYDLPPPRRRRWKQHHPEGGGNRNTTQKDERNPLSTQKDERISSTAQKQKVGKKHDPKGGGWAGQRHSKEGERKSIPPTTKKELQHHPKGRGEKQHHSKGEL